MSENIAYLANNSRARSPFQQHFEKKQQMSTKKETSTLADSTPDSTAVHRKPFLRSGSGLKRRQEASTSEKRYVPKGGFVLDFTETPEPGQRGKKLTCTPAKPARQREPDVRHRAASATSSQASVTPSKSLLDGEAKRSPASSRTKPSSGAARSGLAGRSAAGQAGNGPTDVGSGAKKAPGRATLAAGLADQAARPAAGRQQTARSSMRRPGPPAAGSSPAPAAPQPAAHSRVRGSAAEALPASGAVRQAASWAVEAAGSSRGPPSQGLSQSEVDAEEFGAGVDWDEDAPILPDKERGSGADLLAVPVSSVKDGVVLSSNALSPFVQQLLFGFQVEDAAGSRALVHSGGYAQQSMLGDRQGHSQRGHILKLKVQVEQAAAQLEKDKQEFQRKRAEETAAWEKERDEQRKKLQRERMVLNKQSRAVLKLPTKKDRAEMEALEATLAEERRTARAKDARHKLIVERLRRQIVELQEKNTELREEVRWYEEQRLKSWARQEAASKKASAALLPSISPLAVSLAQDAEALSDPPAPSEEPLNMPPPQQQQQQNEQQQKQAPVAIAQRPSAQETGAVLMSGSHAQAEEPHQAAAAPLAPEPANSAEHRAEASQLRPPERSLSESASQIAPAAVVVGQPDGSSAGSSTDLAAILTRPQRPPAKPLPPVPRFDRWDFRREAGPAAADRGGAAVQLRVECSAASAPAFHHAVLSPFLDDIGSEAVYSPLRASMRASGNSFFGSSRFDGAAAARTSRPATPDLARLNLREKPHLAADVSLSRASSVRSETEAGECSEAATRRSAAYDASAYKNPPGAASRPQRGANAHQGFSQPEQASVSTELRPLHHLIISTLPPSSSAAFGPQQAKLQVALPSRSLEPKLASVAGGAQRTASGLGLAAPGLLAHGSVPVQETRHPDGKVERVFGDGRRALIFANGTLKEHFPDGRSIVMFTNGDVKRTFPDSTVEYFYAEVDTWHATHSDGVEVFYFPSGQTETHHPSGLKEILSADGLVRLVHADGREEDAARSQLSRAAQRGKPSLDSQALAALRMSISSPA